MTTAQLERPATLPLNPAQRAFLRLHAHFLVDQWQWHFCDVQLRAQAEGIGATIWRDDLEHLIRRGLMRQGHGSAVTITEAGKAACESV